AEVRWALGAGSSAKTRGARLFVQYCGGARISGLQESEIRSSLDGSTGGRVIKELPPARPRLASLDRLGSPLTVSFDGVGQDLFLHWRLDCRRRRASRRRQNGCPVGEDSTPNSAAQCCWLASTSRRLASPSTMNARAYGIECAALQSYGYATLYQKFNKIYSLTINKYDRGSAGQPSMGNRAECYLRNAP
uniref:Uncharacterized protein n=1 Tax=Macrostomum lignano TaxID=282301 RepID=A0A1I8FBI2_9PLAT